MIIVAATQFGTVISIISGRLSVLVYAIKGTAVRYAIKGIYVSHPAPLLGR
jgi:hypothetical protein